MEASSSTAVCPVLKKQNNELPPLDDFQLIPQFLQSLTTPLNGTPLFVKELREVVSDVLRSPPHRLDDRYRETSFAIVNELFHFIGPLWLDGDRVLLCLIAHLITAQIRIILDNPATINSGQLSVCCSILENCILCVEDEDAFDLDEESATKISVTTRESIAYVMEYWGKAKETDSEGELPLEVECIFYRVICVFLSIGGAQIIDKNDLKNICPHLIKICWMAVEREEFETAKQLIVVIQELPKLDNTVLKMFLKFIDISGPAKSDAISEIEDAVAVLKDRADWYDKESLLDAKTIAKDNKYTKLAKNLSHV